MTYTPAALRTLARDLENARATYTRQQAAQHGLCRVCKGRHRTAQCPQIGAVLMQERTT